ncbi:hypothetical protein BX616_008503, partial [Lobosporangium transversale]
MGNIILNLILDLILIVNLLYSQSSDSKMSFPFDINNLLSYNDLGGWYSEGNIDQMISGTPFTPPRRSPQLPTEADLSPIRSPTEYQWITPPRNEPRSSTSLEQFGERPNTLDLNPFLSDKQTGERKKAFTRSKASVTKDEYAIIAHTYNAIMNAPPAVQDWFKKTDNRAMDLSILMGVGRNTCVAAIKYAQTGIVEMTGRGRTGRPKKEADKDLNSK